MATWQHLRSSTANKRPTTSLADGRIAINTNTASPGLFFKDSAGTGIVKVGPVHVGTTAPNSVPAAGGSSGNYTGEQWLDTSVSPAQMKVWNGSTWVGIVADELPVSKLQDGAARQLIQTDAAGTGVEWTSDVDVPGTLDVTSTATFDSIAQHPLGTAGAPTITFTGDNNTGIYSPGADQVAISTGGSGRLFVDASGNVGVGGSPSEKLHVQGAGIRIDRAGGDPYVDFYTSGSANNVAIYGGATTGFRAFVGGSERLRITSAGLVGVGTSSPQGRFESAAGDSSSFSIVANNANSTGDANYISLVSGTTQIGSIIRTANDIAIKANYASVSFWTGTSGTATQKAVIDSSGRLGVGTTTVDKLLTLNDTSGATLALKTGANTSSSIHGLEFYDRQGTASFPSSPGQLTSYVRSERNGGNAEFSLTFGTTNSTSANATERLRIDSSGRVGIGTSTVNADLHVFDSSGDAEIRITSNSSNQAILRFGNTVDQTLGSIRFDSPTDSFQFYGLNDTERLRIDSLGRVGIGTTSPAGQLSCTSDFVFGNQSSTGTGGTGRILATGGEVYFQAGLAATSGSAAPIVFTSYGGVGERARIDTSGRLLVGTSSSSASAAAVLQGFAGSSTGQGILQLQVGKNTAATGINENLGSVRFANSDGNIGAWISGEADLQWNSGDYPSRLVFSVTQDGQASPTGRFWIINNGYSYFQSTGQGIAFATTQGAGTTYETILAGHSATNGTFNSINTSFRVFSNGNVQNTNNSYGAISDLKLKENIVNANPQWDDIKALQVRNYNFKEGQTHTQIGLVAQEVELVSPGLVTESPDRDAEGNDLGTVTKSVNYSVLYMKAVKALQEAMERIELLEARLDAANL